MKCATEVIADIIIIIVILIYLIKTQNIKMGRLKLLIYGSITYVCCLVPSIGYSFITIKLGFLKGFITSFTLELLFGTIRVK